MPYNSAFHHFPSLDAAIQAYQAGKPVLLLDDDNRENEADIVAAAQNLSLDTMVKMIRDGSGIVCLSLPGQAVDQLNLPQMVANNQSKNQTGFTISIEAAHGVTTGVSAADRLTTIQAAMAGLDGQAGTLVSPGHIFPLRAVDQGVLARGGHTEGALEIAQLAGMRPAAVICELTNKDGTMATGDDVTAYAQAHGLPILTIETLVNFRQQTSP